MNPKVYVTSNRMRKDSRTGELRPVVDLRPATTYGTLTPVFDHEMDPESLADLRTARERLEPFDQERDYVLPSGAPIASLVTGALLGRRGCEVVNVLEWDKFRLQYTLKVVEL